MLFRSRAVGIVYFYAGARRSGTGERGAIGIDGQIARAVWRGGQWHIVFEGNGGVAAGVGLHQAQLVARLYRRIKVDEEGAIGPDHPGTDHGAVGIADFDSGPRFTSAAQRQAATADCNVADSGRWRDIRCGDLCRQRRDAAVIDGDDIQQFTVGLDRKSVV